MSAPTRYRPPAVPAAVLHSLRDRIAELRRAAGLTQAGLSAAAGLSPAAVGLIETGRSAPALGTLAAIAAALGVPLAALFGAAPAPKKSPKKS